MVDAILPFCASARTSPHNKVFLEGVKAALTADAVFAGGDYTSPPETGLKAFGRVYAGWAYSQTFYRERLHRELGFETFEELLLDWERDHLDWDANDLLAKLRTWQLGDISANRRYGGDFERALGADPGSRESSSPAPPTSTSRPRTNAIEAAHMPNAELRPFDSPWGHCVATPTAARTATSCASSTGASGSCFRGSPGAAGERAGGSEPQRLPRVEGPPGPFYATVRPEPWRFQASREQSMDSRLRGNDG